MEISTSIVKVARISVTCPLTEQDRLEALNYIWNAGYRVITSGPKRIGPGEYSLDTFEVIAEKEIA